MTMGHHDHDHVHANEHTPLIHPHEQISGNGTIIINSNGCVNMVIKTDSSANKSTKRKLAIATTIALLFFATELIAGYFANSLGKKICVSSLSV
jgi:Co/Zn/Cd efflux system component